MSLPFRPRIDWSTFSETLTWPMYPWEVEDATVGGHAVASSGEEEAYVVRHDQLYRLRLRFDEIEWRLIVQPWLRWARERAQSFTLWLDQSDAETQVECLLVAPVAPDPVRPQRSVFLPIMELDIVVRTVGDAPWPGVTWDGDILEES